MTRKMTKSAFLNYLDEECSWRRKELITLKFLHDRARNHEQCLLRRAGVAILYAHWEGFVKKAGTEYVKFVANQYLRYEELADNFVALGMKAQLDSVFDSARGEVFLAAVSFLRGGMADVAKLTWDKAVRTKSNLSCDRLRDILLTLGLDYTPFATKEKTLLRPLLEYRNGIAHGQYLPVDEREFASLHQGTLELVDEFKLQLENVADTKRYRNVSKT